MFWCGYFNQGLIKTQKQPDEQNSEATNEMEFLPEKKKEKRWGHEESRLDMNKEQGTKDFVKAWSSGDIHIHRKPYKLQTD